MIESNVSRSRDYTLHDIDWAYRQSDLITNRAKVINDLLAYSAATSPVAGVAYPRGTGRGVFSFCGVEMFTWRICDVDAVCGVLRCVQAIDDAILLMLNSGRMYFF